MQRIIFLLGYLIRLYLTLNSDVKFPESLKHDYKLALKYPFNNTALGFMAMGDVSYAERFIRISPSIPHKYGYVFSERKIRYNDLMVDIILSVSGRGFAGGNGFAIWITDNIKQSAQNSYYGRNIDFQGFGVILSTSDAKTGRKDPFIFGVQNDGQRQVSDFNDYTSKSSTVLGGCFSNYRNAPDKFHIRLVILSHKLTVYTDPVYHGKSYTECFSANLSLSTLGGKGQHIGISANSLNIADDHDLYSLDVYEINPPPKSNQQKKELSDEDKKKIEKIQHIVDEVENEKDQKSEYGSAITTETVQHIMETQFHIMQKLDYLIKEKSKSSPNSGSATNDNQALEKKIDSMTAQLQALTEKIGKLEGSISRNHNVLEVSLGDVHDRISEAHDTINETHDKTSNNLGKAVSEIERIWSGIKYTAFILGVLIIIYGALAMIRKKEERKFF